ncbi:TLC domain-containing protein 4-B [Brachyhypopomus gauderio]|uniref:TLC domain-containing protein 4-B n=1 Tax=Brachyhypopomus gauderio TaxID=698409 RepID=UPI004041AB22
MTMEPLSPLVLLGSFLVSQWLFHTGGPWLSKRLTSRFATLSRTQSTEWCARVVSTVHAFIVGFLCLYILLFDEATQEDPIWGDPSLVRLSVGITTGYLISDLLLMVFFWDVVGETYFVIHHLAALYAYYYVLSQGILPYFANFRLLSEFSTPFVNQRWFLQVLGYHKLSKPSLVNGVAMAASFFLARIAVIPVYYIHMYSVYGTEAFDRLGLDARFAWVLCSLALDVMNVMWMRRILRGCLKVLRARRLQDAAVERDGRKED